MKKNVQNENLFSKTSKNVVSLATALTLMASGLTGCKNKNDETPKVTTTTTTTTNINPENIVGDEEVLPSNTYSYTKEMWKNFQNSAWDSIKGKINNVNEESFKSALTILNIDFFVGNNPDILIDFCSKGIDIESELSNVYMLLSQIREYNTTISSSSDYYSFNNLLLISKDKFIIKNLEDKAKNVLDMTKGELTEENATEITNIFNEIKDFSLGESSIKLNNDEVYQLDLSKGGLIASENIMQAISVYTQNIISEEERKTLDNSLKMTDVLSQISVSLATYNGIASVLNSSENQEIVNELVNTITNNRKFIYTELSKYMDITEDEVNALYTIANIDYFMNSTNSKNVFKELYKDGFDINKVFEDAEGAAQKIEIYNMGCDDVSKIYSYGHFFIDSEVNIISARAVTEMCYNLHSTDENVVATNVNSLKGYTQYSPLVTINYTKDGETIKLDKNALNKGGNQVIDWITYYGFLNNKSNINNNELVDGMIALVNDTTLGFSPYAEIVLMVEGYCKDNNIAVYDYTVGAKVKTLK